MVTISRALHVKFHSYLISSSCHVGFYIVLSLCKVFFWIIGEFACCLHNVQWRMRFDILFCPNLRLTIRYKKFLTYGTKSQEKSWCQHRLHMSHLMQSWHWPTESRSFIGFFYPIFQVFVLFFKDLPFYFRCNLVWGSQIIN